MPWQVSCAHAHPELLSSANGWPAIVTTAVIVTFSEQGEKFSHKISKKEKKMAGGWGWGWGGGGGAVKLQLKLTAEAPTVNID